MWSDVSAERRWAAGRPAPSLVARTEALGRDLVEELAELLHLVLLLVRDRDARVVQHPVAPVDRRPGTQGERYGVGRASADLDSAGEHQLGVEDALAQIGDPHLGQLLAD